MREATAQGSHALALVEFKRNEELYARGFIGAAGFERREAAMKSAQAQLDQARACRLKCRVDRGLRTPHARGWRNW
jgi:multidrug resistance efflux pump